MLRVQASLPALSASASPPPRSRPAAAPPAPSSRATTTACDTPACCSSTASISPGSIRKPRSFTCASARPKNSSTPSARHRARSPVRYIRLPDAPCKAPCGSATNRSAVSPNASDNPAQDPAPQRKAPRQPQPAKPQDNRPRHKHDNWEADGQSGFELHRSSSMQLMCSTASMVRFGWAVEIDRSRPTCDDSVMLIYQMLAEHALAGSDHSA